MDQKITISTKATVQKTIPRTAPFVKLKFDKEKGEHDYFLCLTITKVNNVEVRTTQEVLDIFKKEFPKISYQGKVLNDLFVPAEVPPDLKDDPNVKNLPHVSLSYFNNFRIDNDSARKIDEGKVTEADNVVNAEPPLDITLYLNQFELVTPCTDKIDVSKGKVITIPRMGEGRDATLGITLSDDDQKKLLNLGKRAFGPDFKGITNLSGVVIPYHFTLAQTSKLVENVNLIKQQGQSVETQPTSKVVTPAPAMY